MKTMLALPYEDGDVTGYYNTRGFDPDPNNEITRIYLGDLLKTGWEIMYRNEDGVLILKKTNQY